MIKKVTIGETSKIPYNLPEGAEIHNLFKGENYMVRLWRFSWEGERPQQTKDKPHKHEGYGDAKLSMLD